MFLCERLIAPAKTNLYLKIGGKIPSLDRHTLESIFVRFNLQDELKIWIRPKNTFDYPNQINCTFDDRLQRHLIASGTDLFSVKGAIEGSKGLISKTLDLLSSHVGNEIYEHCIQVDLHKVIPLEAGLGGGSADAASILNFFSKHFSIESKAIHSIAEQIGFDVGPCLYNSPTYTAFNGSHVVTPINLFYKKYFILILKPTTGSNTSLAYKNLNREIEIGNKQFKDLSIIDKEFVEVFNTKAITGKGISSLIDNDFQDSVFKQIPELSLELDALKKFSPILTGLSGSGSSVFSIFPAYKNAFSAYNACSYLINKGWFLSLNQILCL